MVKKGSKTAPKTFRPIPLLLPVSKIIEKVINDQTQCFVDKNKIIKDISQVLGIFFPLIHVYLT